MKIIKEGEHKKAICSWCFEKATHSANQSSELKEYVCRHYTENSREKEK